jgi:hypothetical protein
MYKTTNFGRYWSIYYLAGIVMNNIDMFNRNILTIGINTSIYCFINGGLSLFYNLNLNNDTISMLYYISSTELLVLTVNNTRLFYVNIFNNFATTITTAYNIASIVYIKNRRALISLYNNSYMMERLQHLPVMNINKTMLSSNDTYEMYINYENTDSQIFNLTTKYADVRMNGKSIKYDKEILIFLSKECDKCKYYDNNIYPKIENSFKNKCKLRKIYYQDNKNMFKELFLYHGTT